MQDEKSESSLNDDEISLIDIIAVLLRYRKMICIMVLCSCVLAAASFVYLIFKQKDEFEVKAVAALSPEALRFISSGWQMSYYFSYPETLREVIEDVKKKIPDFSEEFEWPQKFTRSTDDDGTLYVSEDKKLSLREVSRSVTTEISYKIKDDTENGLVFLRTLLEKVTGILENTVKSGAESYVASYEEIMKNFPLPNIENLQMATEGMVQYIAAKALLDGKAKVVIQRFEPYVEELEKEGKRRYLMIAFVIFFGGSMFSVFLAFCHNAIRNVKKDEEAMRKIHEALAKHGGNQ